jgi:MFS transporter, UMF1 family
LLLNLLAKPFSGIPNKREVWAWGMYDLANQSFTLLINTLFFAVFFREVIVGDPQRGVALWGAVFGGSMLLVVLASPIVGAIADSRAWKKAFLVITGLICVALTCSFGYLGPGMILLAIVLYIPANFCYNIGENFLASFLPQIATPRTMGRISAIGWAMGYIGALLLLICAFIMMRLFGWESKENWAPFFIFAGLWFLIFMIPTMLFLPERGTPDPRASTTSVQKLAHRRLMDTISHARRYAQLVRFFTAFFIYGMGVQTVIAFAAIITRDDFGFSETKLVLFILQLTITAGFAAILTSRYQDRLGHRRTIMIFLGIWAFSALGLTAMTALHLPEFVFWILANGVGLGLGGIGTASRALVAVFTPAHKTAEFFGLWGMVFKSAGVIGPLAFGQLKGFLTGWWPALATPLPLLLLTAFFVVGLLLLFRVDERAGLASAREAEREALQPPGHGQAAAPPAPPGGVLPTSPFPLRSELRSPDDPPPPAPDGGRT